MVISRSFQADKGLKSFLVIARETWSLVRDVIRFHNSEKGFSFAVAPYAVSNENSFS